MRLPRAPNPSLGKITASRLRDAGHTVHLIAEFYGEDARGVPDEEWIAEGCRRAWLLLSKDKRIRYRARELDALEAQVDLKSAGQVLGHPTVAQTAACTHVLADRRAAAAPAVEAHVLGRPRCNIAE